MLAEARAPAERRRRARRGERRAACRSPTASSTRSPSPTCCATSTTRPRRSRELARVVRPGGTIAGPRVRRAARRLARRSGSCTSAPACPRRRSRSASGWREVGSFLGPSIRGFYAALAARAPARGLARRPGSTTSSARRLSLGGGVVTWGRKSVRPAFYALRPGGWRDYVTLLHPPYTRVEPRVRRARRRARAALPHRPDALDDGRVRARARRRRARARRAERPAAADEHPRRRARRARRSPRSPARARSASGPRSRGAGACSPSSRSARSSSRRTTSSGSAAVFHNAWGLALAWAAFPVLTAFYAQAVDAPRRGGPRGRVSRPR